ncbi:MAG TPA: hypothetical protein DCM40_17025 [Maribacter sp.]|jgi:DNA polymerase-3 subunit alpha|nr:hypothetical protein [Maribacter sp.]|tara:strand:+ start:354 stop:1142 length:789 start_codon:yes stop_codon:yes gene_type:complete
MMDMDTLVPIWKSHYSIGRSILTLESPDKCAEDGPDSIIKLCKDNEISDLFLVDDSMAGFLEGCTNAKAAGIKFHFGLRVTVCPDIEIKDEESIRSSCKYIILCKNYSGYERLIKIYSLAAKEGFYYEPRIDFKSIKELWDEKDLTLVVPFYDSFISENNLKIKSCVPDFSFCQPLFFIEDNDLPFDHLLEDLVMRYVTNEFKKPEEHIIKTKSIYYNEKKDFKAYLTFKCINKRASLDKPNLDHMCSDEFSLESWKEVANG